MVCVCLLYNSREEKNKQTLFLRSKFSFSYEDIWFDVGKFKFIFKKKQFKTLVMFWPIFAADTKVKQLYYTFCCKLPTFFRSCSIYVSNKCYFQGSQDSKFFPFQKVLSKIFKKLLKLQKSHNLRNF